MSETVLPPGTRIDGYELLEGLRSSVTAEVHVAKDETGREVILKLAHAEAQFDVEHPDYNRRSRLVRRSLEEGAVELIPDPEEVLLQEASTTRSLEPNGSGPKLIEVREWQNRSYLVREYIEGTFWDLMLLEGTLQVRHIIDLIEHLVCLGDEFGTFHGDLKPCHLLYDAQSRLRWISPTAGSFRPAQNGQLDFEEVLVTPAYNPKLHPRDHSAVGMMLIQTLCRLVYLEPGPLPVALGNGPLKFHALGRTLPDAWPLITHLPLPSHYDIDCPEELERVALGLAGFEFENGCLENSAKPIRYEEALEQLRPFADYEPTRTQPRLTLHPTGLRMGEDDGGRPVPLELIHEIQLDGRSYWLAERIAPPGFLILEASADGLESVENPDVLDRISAYLSVLMASLENPELRIAPAGAAETARIEDLFALLPDWVPPKP